MRTATELEPLFKQAARETAKGSKSFYFATRFFPAELARAAHSVYWFCRFTDDLVDDCETVEQGRRDLENWENALRDGIRRSESEHPVLQLFLHTAREREIPLEYAFELIEGMRMDLNGTRYGNFEELRLFCYRAASVVGLMMCSVIGLTREGDRAQARKHATDLGIAMQLTNILRDIGEDLERGRVYLPTEEMERFGYSETALRQHSRNAAFANLMMYQVERARTYYADGNAGIRMLNPDGRFAVKVASDVYRQILVRIEESNFDVFEHRAVVSPAQKYWLTMRNMAFPIARYSASKAAFWRT